ncbi:MAG TPA: DPP IV N-terminal domain-containing protein [Longimicrobiales bacterium]
MKRFLTLAMALAVAGCIENDPTGSAKAPVPQRDHTSALYPADAGLGAMAATLLTSWAGVDRSPTWSPDGSRIAFASNRFTGLASSIASSIYVMDASGDASGLRRLTTGTVDQQPTWSPDGGTIVFIRNGGIYRVSSGGGPVTMLMAQNSGASDPRYSPDGTRIAFARNNQVFVIPVFGGSAAQVTPDGAVNAYPEWLDANTLLYTQLLNGEESIWKITVGDATSAARLTAPEAGMFRYADMKADGSVLAFTSSDLVFQDMSNGLHTIGRLSVQPVTDAAGANVEFSPDGTKVLFAALGATPGSSDIYVAAVPELRSNLDLTPPVVTANLGGTLGQNGWYTSDVTVDFTVSDPESGIATQNGCSQTVISSDGAITVTCTATNGAGLQTVNAVSVNRDATAPVIAFAGNLSYRVDQEIDITCSATDATSGLATSSCPNVAGGAAYTFAESSTRTATAVDSAGNATSQDVTFTVSATFDALSALVWQTVPQRGVANSLSAKLKAAAAARSENARAGQLKAFVAEVQAQTGKALTPEHADVLIRWANTL